MSVVRVNKNDNYTIMSNYHLQDKNLSLKAKGLLSMMLSLPDNWHYTIEGLVAICKENETSVISALKELKHFGYLVMTKKMPNETDSGRYEYIYDVYEMPKQEGKKQDLENLGVEILGVENQGLLNTNKLNTNKQKTKVYSKYGAFQRIKLTNEEYEKLVNDYGKEYIDDLIMKLDEYVESNNNKNKYTNFNLVIRKAIREKWFNIENASSGSEWWDKTKKELEAKKESSGSAWLDNFNKQFK